MGSGQNDDVATGSSQHDQSDTNVPEPPMQSHSQQEDKVDNTETDIEANTVKRTARQKTHSQKACRSEEHTSELQSHSDLVCRLLLEKKKKNKNNNVTI